MLLEIAHQLLQRIDEFHNITGTGGGITGAILRTLSLIVQYIATSVRREFDVDFFASHHTYQQELIVFLNAVDIAV